MTLPPVQDDPDPERKKLRLINDAGISVIEILTAAATEGCPIPCDLDAAHRFISGRTASPREATRNAWRHFLSTAQAKTWLTPSSKNSFDFFVDYFSSGNTTGRQIAGAYLEFHGSYLEEDCFAVRLIEITQVGSKVSVTDYINETRSGLGGAHTARGGAVLFGDPLRFNIVTYAEKEDNRIGLSLFTAAILRFDPYDVLQSSHGYVTGLTRTGFSFKRGSRIVRVSDTLSPEEREIYEKKTGVFQWSELKEHESQFEMLIDHMRRTKEMQPIFNDPCAQ